MSLSRSAWVKPLTVNEMRDFDPDIATPKYKLYADDVDGTKDPVPDVDNVTPEEGDNFISA